MCEVLSSSVLPHHQLTKSELKFLEGSDHVFSFAHFCLFSIGIYVYMYIFVMGFVDCVVVCWLWCAHLTRLWSWKFKKESVSLCHLLWHFKAILSKTKLLSHSTHIYSAQTVYQAPCQVLELQYREDRHFTDFK